MNRASAISRMLRKQGFGVVCDRSREGLLVSNSILDTVTVTVQRDRQNESLRDAAEVAEFLSARGYNVRLSGNIITVE